MVDLGFVLEIVLDQGMAGLCVKSRKKSTHALSCQSHLLHQYVALPPSQEGMLRSEASSHSAHSVATVKGQEGSPAGPGTRASLSSRVCLGAGSSSGAGARADSAGSISEPVAGAATMLGARTSARADLSSRICEGPGSRSEVDARAGLGARAGT
jgi:hypothetical protein